jgi:hypothetical protein
MEGDFKMKKLLVLLVVLSLVTTANAALTLRVVNTAGTTVTTLAVGSAYTAIVNGSSLGGVTGGVYGPTLTSDDWTNIAPGVASPFAAAGDMGVINWLPDFQGWDFTSDDASTVVLPNQVTGDWFTIGLTPTHAGAAELDLYNYSISDSVPIQTIGLTITAVPEPVTMALLGLGGLFLRRRSK